MTAAQRLSSGPPCRRPWLLDL